MRQDEKGNYYIVYVIENPPKAVDRNVWGAAVQDYLGQHGVSDVTAHTVMANPDWAEIRRTYNRLIGEGKQRRSVNSHEAPAAPFTTREVPRD